MAEHMITHINGATAAEPTRRRVSVWRTAHPEFNPRRWLAYCGRCGDEWHSITWNTAMIWADAHARKHQ